MPKHKPRKEDIIGYSLDLFNKKMEVISNIHETPELLKETP